mmetsp:Transcript_17476/g.28256  ORF Transcript_17476/g.28256 Transcript_17476/m.28256 type:complete len:365 (-) Transcript_17476:1515-2609(-)|eukprot:CAMPEP_0203758846 /NCGR_PEP_ID=MMETSP0098-20131031/11717_1 /ASSEMBLY_ACC=CAM_ASM_000208 /TAXON_ID=96639 /ORGANISM=" , Strain NY0313808BC1" /LENGTH=364 /DNA_ID=CAMNT_0050651481 /DNA_START=132 /DNA_END=1222 /DNA_ORIENTATION=-
MSMFRQLHRAVRDAVDPLVRSNGHVYAWFNKRSARFLKDRGETLVPKGVTANGITTARTSLVFPTMFLFSNGFTILPAACVVVNVTFDYVDGAVARWEREKKQRDMLNSDLPAVREMKSAYTTRLQDTWGAYYDAIADKAFAIPVWMCAFQHFSDSPILQSALLSHALVEGYSCFVRTKAYYEEPNPIKWVMQPTCQDTVAQGTGDKAVAVTVSQPTSAVVAGITGKTKQFLSMLGTACIMVPLTKTIGTGLLCVSVPLAIGSVLQKSKQKVVYAEVDASCEKFSSKTLEYIEESRTLGSRLIIGLRKGPEWTQEQEDEMIKILQLNPSVHSVLPHPLLPPKHQVHATSFTSKYNIDIVVPLSS